MGIGLVSHIPDDLVFWQIKGQMQRHGQLHHAQIGRQMSAGHTDLLDQKPADLLRQLFQFLFIQLFDIIHLINFL